MFENEKGFRFRSEEDRSRHFSEGEKRVEENMEIARRKFSGENEEWGKIVEYIEEEAKKETDIDTIIISAKKRSDGFDDDCFYTLYQAIILKLQLIDERGTYAVKGETEK